MLIFVALQLLLNLPSRKSFSMSRKMRISVLGARPANNGNELLHMNRTEFHHKIYSAALNPSSKSFHMHSIIHEATIGPDQKKYKHKLLVRPDNVYYNKDRQTFDINHIIFIQR